MLRHAAGSDADQQAPHRPHDNHHCCGGLHTLNEDDHADGLVVPFAHTASKEAGDSEDVLEGDVQRTLLQLDACVGHINDALEEVREALQQLREAN